MKYHYQIISSFDPTDIPENTNNGIFRGWNTYEKADEAGEILLKLYNPDQYYVKVIPVPESPAEEDILENNVYPEYPEKDYQ